MAPVVVKLSLAGRLPQMGGQSSVGSSAGKLKSLGCCALCVLPFFMSLYSSPSNKNKIFFFFLKNEKWFK